MERYEVLLLKLNYEKKKQLYPKNQYLIKYGNSIKQGVIYIIRAVKLL